MASMDSERVTGLSLAALLIMTSLAGCTGLASSTPNASISADRMTIDVGETVNFDARDSTTPAPTIIDEYVWDFGDGESRTTKTGIVSHSFAEAGNHEVEVDVFNDRGESDRATISIFVNSPPIVVLEMPGYVRTNATATIDASGSYDLEGGSVEFIWDLDLTFDTNGDGDPANDADDNHASVEVSSANSGDLSGSVMVIDDKGATTTQIWHLMVVKRMFKVIWEEQRISAEWNGHTEQGLSSIIEQLPGKGARIMQVNATLVLDRDLLPIQWPEDNFTLRVNVPMTGWTTMVHTAQSNVTLNATASIDRGEMNPYPNSGYTVSADSAESLVASLLNEPGARFGQGDWIWTIAAVQCDPDLPIDGIDPDTGNDWTFTVEFVILIPRVSEVGS
ncbi:MAG TPA: PKD domain-containing protein [Candidatus Poseidoniales archaeon]|nr:PKD domain-containing protein [Candidatus Poseidoniales archaeon]